MRSHLTTTRIQVLAALGGLVLVLAACSSSPGASAAPSTAASPSGGAATITVAIANGPVGTYLTGPNGMTLYTLKTDSASTTTCTGTCAQNWPPFTIASGDTFQPGSGVTGALASFSRPDGTLQVTYDGRPLYYFAADSKAGDTKGQGVGGKWFVASPSGGAPASAAPSSSGGSNY